MQWGPAVRPEQIYFEFTVLSLFLKTKQKEPHLKM